MSPGVDSAIASYGWVCLTTLVILVCFTSRVSAGGLYRCLDPLGVEIFTDSPAQLATCVPMNVGTAQSAPGIVSPPDSELEAVKDRPRAESPDVDHSGIAIPPDSDTPSAPSVSLTSPSDTAASSPEGRVP